jgi:hypothetical protein
MTNPGDLTPDQQALVGMLREDAENRYLEGDCGALRHSVAHRPHDPAFTLLLDGKHSVPRVHRRGCYICEDPEFAAMGMPLCMPCARCGGHIPADDESCDDCGWSANPHHQDPTCGLDPASYDELQFGDYETSEPYLVVTGTRYDGLPLCFGDLRDDEVEKREGDRVLDLTMTGSWRGTVVQVLAHPVTLRLDSEGRHEEGSYPYEATVLVEYGAGVHQPGDLVRTRPQWLRVIP